MNRVIPEWEWFLRNITAFFVIGSLFSSNRLIEVTNLVIFLLTFTFYEIYQIRIPTPDIEQPILLILLYKKPV